MSDNGNTNGNGNGGPPRRVTVPWLREARAEGRRISMVTAYDAPSARLADAAGVDALLVGDSIGSTVMGFRETLKVTMDDIVRATQAVARGAKRPLIVADLPFGSYQGSDDEGMKNAIRLVKEGGAHAVKLEGGVPMLPLVRRLVAVGIPVVGHLGFTPQSVHALGGARVQGKTAPVAQPILDGARGLEEAGAFMVVLELIPAELARLITNTVTIPTIGIGAGPECDGQVQVWHDVLGLTEKPLRHVRRYADLGSVIKDALANYVLDVQGGQFPTMEHAARMDRSELNDLDAERGFAAADRSTLEDNEPYTFREPVELG